MSALEKDLDHPDLTLEERNAVVDKMFRLIDLRGAKDTENKAFILQLAREHQKTALVAVGGLVVVAVAAVAGPTGIKSLGTLIPAVARRALG